MTIPGIKSKWFPAATAAALAAWLLQRRGNAAPFPSVPEICPTIYGGSTGLADQLSRSLAWLGPIAPDGINLHTTMEDIRDHAPQWVARVRAVLPTAAVWFSTTGDEHYSDVQAGRWTVERLQRLRLDAAIAAAHAGAQVLMHDCEAQWKHDAPGFRAGDAADMIAAIRAAVPQLGQWLTSYYAPTYHSEFPWHGFARVDGYSPQIYYNAGGGEAAWDLFRRSWSRAIQLGWMNDHALLAAYVRVRADVGTLIETSKITDAFGTVNTWWLNEGCDDVLGKPLIRSLCKLRKLGFRGQGRIAAFQRAHGLLVDSKIGPVTLAAINAA